MDVNGRGSYKKGNSPGVSFGFISFEIPSKYLSSLSRGTLQPHPFKALKFVSTNSFESPNTSGSNFDPEDLNSAIAYKWKLYLDTITVPLALFLFSVPGLCASKVFSGLSILKLIIPMSIYFRIRRRKNTIFLLILSRFYATVPSF